MPRLTCTSSRRCVRSTDTPSSCCSIQLALLIAVARVGAELVKRLGLPAVVGELGAGIALGPTVLGHYAPATFLTLFPRDAAQFHLLDVFGSVGMALLMLITGLETDVRLLRNLGRAALIASAMGMMLPFVLGFGLGYLMPAEYLADPQSRAPVLGLPRDRDVDLGDAGHRQDPGRPGSHQAQHRPGDPVGRRGRRHRRLADPVADRRRGVARRGPHGAARVHAGQRWARSWSLAALVLYPLLRLVIRITATRFRTRDSDLVVMIVVTFLCAAATEWIGVHAVFGAFVAGVVLHQVPRVRKETVARLESFVFSVLAPVFFGIVGLKVNLWSLGGGGMLALVIGVACLGKLVGCTLGAIWGGLRFWEAASIAVAMNARGAMEIVVAIDRPVAGDPEHADVLDHRHGRDRDVVHGAGRPAADHAARAHDRRRSEAHPGVGVEGRVRSAAPARAAGDRRRPERDRRRVAGVRAGRAQRQPAGGASTPR